MSATPPENDGGAEPAGLLAIAVSAPGSVDGDAVFLDEKAVEGLRLYAQFWPGRVRAVFRLGPPSALLFGQRYDRSALPFEVAFVEPGCALPDSLVADAAIMVGAGDNHLDFALADACARTGVPLVYIIEYILETRLQIVALSDKPLAARLKTTLWTLLSERRRRRAFRRAVALQSNGTPAAAAYRQLVPDVLTFFDTRLLDSMLVTDAEQRARVASLAAGAPLRLAFSGRLERMKGADDLVPIARAIARAGVRFTLDIYGSGSLETAIRTAIADAGLGESVRLHAPLPFATGLVPTMRRSVDLFLCCHKQSDPSCTYLETLGCGIPIVGYRNRAFAGLLELAPIGWSVPIGDVAGAAARIVMLDRERDAIAAAADAARTFAAGHSFERTFAARVDHLSALAIRPAADPPVGLV